MPHKYTVVSVGCYGDGSFGHEHVRSRLAALMTDLARNSAHPGDAQTATEIAEALIAPMTDDASEEYDAISLLNESACDGTHFEMVDGDLMLLSGGA